MKRIVFVLGNYKNGGMAMHATNLMNEYATRGYVCDILALGEVSDKPFTTLGNNVTVVDVAKYNAEHSDDPAVISDRKRRFAEIKRLKRLRYFTRFFPSKDKEISRRIKVLRAGEKLRPYFVNNHGVTAIAFGVSYIAGTVGATDGLECKVIYAEKNAPQIEFGGEAPDNDYCFDLLNSINAVIVQTADAKNYLGQFVGNVKVINNPVKPDLPSPFTGERRHTIVNFCRMSGQKNIGLLLDAFALFRKTHPDYSLEVYGNTVSSEEETYRDEMIAKAESMGLADAVRILPPAADVHQKVRDAAMFVSSSDYEGLSNSMLEAMAIGLPCVCTDCLGGGTREVMTDGDNGLIIPMNDPHAMSKAMIRFAEHPELADSCSREAAKIRETLSVKTIAKQWLEVIENC